MRPTKLLGCGVIALASAAHAQSLHDISNLGTQDWSQAARTGRSDMLILGDSVTWFESHGWDAGLNEAASQTFGLAGTGLIADSGLTGQGYGYQTENGYYGTNWDGSLGAIPVAQQGYALRTGAAGDTAVGPSASNFGYNVSGQTLSSSAAYDWNLYTAGGAGGGTTSAYRRIASATDGFYYNTLQTDAAVSIPSTSTGLTKVTFSFAANPYGDVPQEMWLQNATNVSVLYSRLITPGAKGVTVSSLGYGGKDTHQFYTDILESMSTDGRSTYLQSLVDGSNSGKLNIVLAEGFNDANDTSESVNNVAPGDTPAGFKDNISSMISLLRSDWAGLGYQSNNLSFTLVGMYQDAYEATDGSGPLHAFAADEMAMAVADPQISFVDLYDDAPDYAAGNAMGNFQSYAGQPNDPIHPSAAGAQLYSNIVLSVIAAPEPASLSFLAVGAMMLGRRRKLTVARRASV